MNKFLFIFLSLFIFTALNSQAALYKGQRVFMKVCTQCHENGESFVSSKNRRVWKKYMKKQGSMLSDVHIKSKKYQKEKKVIESKKYTEYFKSKQYKKNIKHLKQFLIEYAKDSDNVPACN